MSKPNPLRWLLDQNVRLIFSSTDAAATRLDSEAHLVHHKNGKQALPVQVLQHLYEGAALHKLLWRHVQQLAAWELLTQLTEHRPPLNDRLLGVEIGGGNPAPREGPQRPDLHSRSYRAQGVKSATTTNIISKLSVWRRPLHCGNCQPAKNSEQGSEQLEASVAGGQQLTAEWTSGCQPGLASKTVVETPPPLLLATPPLAAAPQNVLLLAVLFGPPMAKQDC